MKGHGISKSQGAANTDTWQPKKEAEAHHVAWQPSQNDTQLKLTPSKAEEAAKKAEAGKAGSKQAGKALPKQAQLNNLIIN